MPPPPPVEVLFTAPAEGEADVRLTERIRMQLSRDLESGDAEGPHPHHVFVDRLARARRGAAAIGGVHDQLHARKPRAGDSADGAVRTVSGGDDGDSAGREGNRRRRHAAVQADVYDRRVVAAAASGAASSWNDSETVRRARLLAVHLIGQLQHVLARSPAARASTSAMRDRLPVGHLRRRRDDQRQRLTLTTSARGRRRPTHRRAAALRCAIFRCAETARRSARTYVNPVLGPRRNAVTAARSHDRFNALRQAHRPRGHTRRARFGLGRREIARSRAHPDTRTRHAHRDSAEPAIEVGIRGVVAHQVIRVQVRHHARHAALDVIGIEDHRAVGIRGELAEAALPLAPSVAGPASAWPGAAARWNRRTRPGRGDRPRRT